MRRAGSRAFAGTASGGRGKLKPRRLRVKRVEIAVLRTTGKGCRWLASSSGRMKARKAASDGACDRPVWLRAKGARHWRYELDGSLASGRYVVFSRAVLATGDFHEARFSAKDGNRRAFSAG